MSPHSSLAGRKLLKESLRESTVLYVLEFGDIHIEIMR